MTVFIGRAGVAPGVRQRKTNAPSVIFGSMAFEKTISDLKKVHWASCASGLVPGVVPKVVPGQSGLLDLKTCQKASVN